MTQRDRGKDPFRADDSATLSSAGSGGGGGGTVALGELFNPVKGTAPATMVTYSVASAGQTLTNTTLTYWDGATTGAVATPANTKKRFNTLGQRWQAVATNNTDGVKNAATPQTISGVIPPHCLWFETAFTGDKLDIGILGISNPWDFQVWVDAGGGLYRLADTPISNTATGLQYVKLTFPSYARRRIVVRMGNAYFSHLRHETSAMVATPPNRHLIITDGDSYIEDRTNLNPGSTRPTFHCGGIAYHLFEITGCPTAGRAQGGTGFFQNGDGVARTNDTAGTYNGTRWFSQSRKDWVAPDIAAKPLAYVINGTINDGALSGGKTAMKARALACYQWLRGQDSAMAIVHVSPEPYNNPVAGNVHDLNMQGQAEAMATITGGYYINAFGPTSGTVPPATEPWFTGSGYNDSPSDSQQARVTGGDQIHRNFPGYLDYAYRIADALRPIQIPASRAYETAVS